MLLQKDLQRLPTTIAGDCVREKATFVRFRLKRKSIPRGQSLS